MKYLAVESGEILFTFQAESQASAEGYADLKVFTEMHDCHHESWCKNGRVYRVDVYEKEIR